MKTYKSNLETVQAWVNNNAYEGKNTSKSIFFEGDTIYSYGSHYAMAKTLGNGFYLLNDTSYSNTTSKQMSLLFRSLRLANKTKVISVKNPLGTIEENLKYFDEKIQGLEAKKAKSRLYKDFFTQQIEQIKIDKNDYLSLMQ